MLRVYIKPDILDKDLTQIGFIVEVSDVDDFTNILHTSGEVRESTTLYTLSMEFIPGKTYYIRARQIYNLGLSDWIETTYVSVAGDKDELFLYPLSPILVKHPILRLEYSPNDHPSKEFKVFSDFKPPLNNPIVRTTWIIEDVNGLPVIYIPENNTHINSIRVTKQLKKNELYTVRCRHILKSGDSSFFAGKSFFTVDGNKGFDIIYPLLKRTESIFTITYKMPLGANVIEYEVLKDGKLVTKNNVTDDTIDISSILSGSGTFHIRARTSINNVKTNWVYYTTDVYDASTGVLPYDLPHSF